MHALLKGHTEILPPAPWTTLSDVARTIMIVICFNQAIPYSRKYWRGTNFFELPICPRIGNIKSARFSFWVRFHERVVSYGHTKIALIAKVGYRQSRGFFNQIAKYNSRQYFRLYGNTQVLLYIDTIVIDYHVVRITHTHTF